MRFLRGGRGFLCTVQQMYIARGEGKIVTYNVFMASSKERYAERAGQLGIPEGTSLPVLIIGEEWFSGYEEMEESLYRVLVEKRGAVK